MSTAAWIKDDGTIQSPYPFFGGKSAIAAEVWRRFGDVPNVIEPFFGSGAVLLGRPLPFDGSETVNDADGMIANFWRAVQAEPEAVARYADWPVFENDLHARHAWLVERKESLQARLEGEPEFYDAKIAGYWCWGMSLWIGGGFCSGQGPWRVVEVDGVRQLVHLSNAGRGVNRQRVHLGNAGQGVNRQLVHLSDAGQGVNRKPTDGEIYAWMQALSDRLKRVRVCCGDWRRVCGGRSGNALQHFFASGNSCAVCLDPPYSDAAQRDADLYRVDCLQVAHDVRRWCLQQGHDPRLRIALCGYDGEHNELEQHGWSVLEWKARGGYASQAEEDNGNCRRERIWFSPHCVQPEAERLLF